MWQFFFHNTYPVQWRKYFIGSLILGLLLLPSLRSLTALLTDARIPPKKVSKSRPCCTLGIALRSGPGRVILEQICAKERYSTFHFRTINLPSTCTHPPATIVRDQRGKQYRMLKHTGLPPCSGRKFQTKANVTFTWSFERLRPGTRSIMVAEAVAPVTVGMSHWLWPNVSVAHCKFK